MFIWLSQIIHGSAETSKFYNSTVTVIDKEWFRILSPQGCYNIVEDYVQQWMTIAGSGALVFMFIQVIAIFLNISLHRRYREHEDYQLQVMT